MKAVVIGVYGQPSPTITKFELYEGDSTVPTGVIRPFLEYVIASIEAY